MSVLVGPQTGDRKVPGSRPDDDVTLRGRPWFEGHVKPSVLSIVSREGVMVLTSPR